MTGKPRPASSPQLAALNGIGALAIVEPGTSERISYDEAWDVLRAAALAGDWKPKRAVEEVVESGRTSA